MRAPRRREAPISAVVKGMITDPREAHRLVVGGATFWEGRCEALVDQCAADEPVVPLEAVTKYVVVSGGPTHEDIAHELRSIRARRRRQQERARWLISNSLVAGVALERLEATLTQGGSAWPV